MYNCEINALKFVANFQISRIFPYKNSILLGFCFSSPGKNSSSLTYYSSQTDANSLILSVEDGCLILTVPSFTILPFLFFFVMRTSTVLSKTGDGAFDVATWLQSLYRGDEVVDNLLVQQTQRALFRAMTAALIHQVPLGVSSVNPHSPQPPQMPQVLLAMMQSGKTSNTGFWCIKLTPSHLRYFRRLIDVSSFE